MLHKFSSSNFFHILSSILPPALAKSQFRKNAPQTRISDTNYARGNIDIFCHQFCRQCRQNVFAIFGMLESMWLVTQQYFLIDALGEGQNPCIITGCIGFGPHRS